MPNDRVLKTLRTKSRVFEQKALTFFVEKDIDTAQIERFLTDANVNFSESKQRLKPCNYYQVETIYEQRKNRLIPQKL